MNDIKTTLKDAVIVRVGKMEKTDKNGVPFKYDSTKVGVIFDFAPDVWHSGFIYPSQVSKIKEGSSVQIEVFDSIGSNGTVYKNFRFPKKAAVESALVKELQSTLEELKARVSKLESRSLTPVPQDDGGDLNPEDFDF